MASKTETKNTKEIKFRPVEATESGPLQLFTKLKVDNAGNERKAGDIIAEGKFVGLEENNLDPNNKEIVIMQTDGKVKNNVKQNKLLGSQMEGIAVGSTVRITFQGIYNNPKAKTKLAATSATTKVEVLNEATGLFEQRSSSNTVFVDYRTCTAGQELATGIYLGKKENSRWPGSFNYIVEDMNDSSKKTYLKQVASLTTVMSNVKVGDLIRVSYVGGEAYTDRDGTQKTKHNILVETD